MGDEKKIIYILTIFFNSSMLSLSSAFTLKSIKELQKQYKGSYDLKVDMDKGLTIVS